jgi:hypothetical protein
MWRCAAEADGQKVIPDPSFSNYCPSHQMSPPPPRPAQHLVPEADRELYADRLRCQEQGVISLDVRSSGHAGATEDGRETDFLSGCRGA